MIKCNISLQRDFPTSVVFQLPYFIIYFTEMLSNLHFRWHLTWSENRVACWRG